MIFFSRHEKEISSALLMGSPVFLYIVLRSSYSVAVTFSASSDGNCVVSVTFVSCVSSEIVLDSFDIFHVLIVCMVKTSVKFLFLVTFTVHEYLLITIKWKAQNTFRKLYLSILFTKKKFTLTQDEEAFKTIIVEKSSPIDAFHTHRPNTSLHHVNQLNFNKSSAVANVSFS